MPKARFGVLVPSQAGDAGGSDDQAIPVRAGRADTTGNVKDIDVAMLLAAMALAVDGSETIDSRLAGGDAAQRLQQVQLVALDLCQQGISAAFRRLKGFFDSGAHRP
jgi:hypothetical protein